MNHLDLLWQPLLQKTGLLLLGTLLGGCIGWERERQERPAGLRTHILVCVGATLITLVDNSNPASGGRIAAQIVTGVGFLGAGTILRDGSGASVRGLTTAASLWAVAGLGIAIGHGGLYPILGAIATAIILFNLTILSRCEGWLNKRRKRQDLIITIKGGGDVLSKLQQILSGVQQAGIRTRNLQFTQIPESGLNVQMQVSIPRHIHRETIDAILHSKSEIVHYNWG